jgi:hypothetical protein
MREPASLAGSAFVGEWEVRRKVVDHRAATTATFVGRAKITSRRFEERGRLTLGSAALDATRAYRLRPNERSVSVAHLDGSPFIALDYQPSQTVRHQCGADLYVGRFFFVDVDTWAEAWRVIGPRKHYASLTHYRRLSR